MEKKKLIFLCLIMIIFIMIPIGISAEGEQEQPIQEDIIMEAKIGFDGHYRLGAWTPITVEIENLGQDIDGLIEVRVNQEGNSAISYSSPAVVAKNSKKRFVLHAQVNTIQKKFNIELKQKDKTIKSLEIKSLVPMTLNKYLIGVVTDDKPALGYWWRTLGEGSIFTNHDTVHVKADEFSDRIEVIDNFAMLVINNADTSILTQKQQEVLGQWINNGGILIVGTGPNATKTLSGLRPDIVDVQIGDMFQSNPIKEIEETKLNLTALSLQEGQKLMEDNGQGIVWGLEKGKGKIFVSAFDLGLEPFAGWQGNKDFWETILTTNLNPDTVSVLRDPNHISNMNQKFVYGSNYQIREALGSIKALDLPSYTNLILILIGYLLVVGPINYIILKKLDRREWMWFTIPAFVVLFSVGIYAMGYLQKGNEIIINTVSTINLNSSNSADINTYAGVFIPQRGDYDISVDSDTLLTLYGEGGIDDMHYPNSVEEQQKMIKARISQGNPSSITLYDSNVWTMRTFILKDLNTDFGEIKGELFYQNGKIKGTVTNNTPYPLEDVIIYNPTGSYEKIGNLASGAKKEVSLNVSNLSGQYGAQIDPLYMMIEDLYPYSSFENDPNSDKARDIWIKRNLVDGVIMNDYSQNLSSRSYISILGFCDYRPEEKIKVNGTEPSAFQYKGVVVSGFDVTYEQDGMINIPPGYIKGVLDKGLSDNVSQVDIGFYLERGQAVFNFDMTPYMDLELFKIELHAMATSGSIVLSLYDVDQGNYMETSDHFVNDKGRGTITIKAESLNRFVNESGVLQIRVQGEARDYTSFETPSLVIEGRRR